MLQSDQIFLEITANKQKIHFINMFNIILKISLLYNIVPIIYARTQPTTRQ